MGKLLVKNYLHIMYSTKNRQRLTSWAIKNELCSYSGWAHNEKPRMPVKISGYEDHVHILCTLSKKNAIMKLLEQVKSNSSRWIKTADKELAVFYWQDAGLTGKARYKTFSINPSEIDVVIKYITNQAAHHHTTRFTDEYRAFLKKYKIGYDERCVRD